MTGDPGGLLVVRGEGGWGAINGTVVACLGICTAFNQLQGGNVVERGKGMDINELGLKLRVCCKEAI